MPVNLYALTEARPGHPKHGEPFYIGIGSAKRPYRHLMQSRAKKGHPNLRLHEILVSHSALGVVPGITILGTFATKDEAGKAEIEMIRRYGRMGFDEGGVLSNLARGGQGIDTEVMKAMWAIPEVKARRSAAMRGKAKSSSPQALEARRANAKKAQSPEARAKKGEAARRMWADPAFIERRRRNQAEAWQDPEKRARMLANRSQGIAKSWEDPDVRSRRIKGIKAATPVVEKPEPKKGPGRSATMSAVNAAKTPEDRAAEQAASWANPEVRERRLEGLRRAAQDPELAAKRVAAMLEGKRRKAAARAAVAESSDGADLHESEPD